VGPTLKLLDGNSNLVTVEWKSNYSSHKTLGCYLEQRGNLLGMKQHLRSKIAKFHHVLVSSALNRPEAWTFYFAIYLPSIGYPLPLCHFSKKELNLLHRKVMSEMIAQCGFCLKKCKTEIIYGPADLGGTCFSAIHMASKAQDKFYSFSNTGRVLVKQDCLLGSPSLGPSFRSVLANPSSRTIPLPYPTRKHAGLLRSASQIEVNNCFVLPQQREHDSYIMDLVLASGHFKPTELDQINYCHLFLQPLTVSNLMLVLADGVHLDPHMHIGKLASTSSITTLHRINQAQPNAGPLQLWHCTNLLWATPQLRLIQPLGRWLQPSPQL
jgi:hypothetical protein